jgi:hypothetical protein
MKKAKLAAKRRAHQGVTAKEFGRKLDAALARLDPTRRDYLDAMARGRLRRWANHQKISDAKESPPRAAADGKAAARKR